jgi:hypothetical protein
MLKEAPTRFRTSPAAGPHSESSLGPAGMEKPPDVFVRLLVHA